MLAGQTILGAGLIVARGGAVARLLMRLLSGVVELNTEAVLLIVEPLAAEQLTSATITISVGMLGDKDANVTVRTLPDPPHTPPPVELHETTVTFPENTSVTVTDVAVPGPKFVTRIRLVI